MKPYFRLEILIHPLHERKEDIKNLVTENQILLRGKEIGDGFYINIKLIPGEKKMMNDEKNL